MTRPTRLIRMAPRPQAGGVGYDNTGSGLTSDNVQDAIDELEGLIDGLDSGGAVKVSDVETYHRFLVIAHHGDMNDVDGYPEDTLEGYRLAILNGANGVDLDLRQTSDGEWVSIHDATLDRTTNLSGNVSSTTLAAIQAGHIDGGVGYDAGRHGTSLKVPTLDDIIEALAPYDCTFWFDNKVPNDTTAELLAQYIVDNDLVSRVRLHANDAGQIAAIQAVNANITIGGVDYGSLDYFDIADLAEVISFAPQKIFGSVPISEYPSTDEGVVAEDLFEKGARGIIANEIGGVVTAVNAFLYDGGATGAAGGDLSGTYPNPSVVDDSHNHTAATLPAASSGSTHEHVLNIVFSGDGSATVWELPAAPVDSTSIAVYVTAARSIAWTLSGTMFTTLTFDSAPPSASNNIIIDIVAATA